MKPPKNLSREAKALWKSITTEFCIDDPAGLSILRTALEALDRMRNAQEIISEEGLTIRDRWGQVKSHPLTTVERDSRSGFLHGLKALNLDLEPLRDQAGRSPGRR